ncbi:hypothetical protein BJY52DRAFT_1189424, partial [Lactarius psammicola]
MTSPSIISTPIISTIANFALYLLDKGLSTHSIITMIPPCYWTKVRPTDQKKLFETKRDVVFSLDYSPSPSSSSSTPTSVMSPLDILELESAILALFITTAVDTLTTASDHRNIAIWIHKRSSPPKPPL